MKRRGKNWLPDNVELANGEKLHKKHPTTFEMPDRSERENLKPGSTVKLLFQWIKQPEGQHFAGERMWVTIKFVNRDEPKYTGELDSLPVDLPLNPGDLVRFGPENIICILEEALQ